MVCKEELCNWFKNLRPHQRIDYMCGLLHMCLPLELRFIGSVLEDHGRKNYNFLRDAELKANNNAEISKLDCASDKQLRATVSVYLSLLHSSNTSCAQLLYELLEKNLHRAFSLGSDPSTNEEILMALVLAINHPAFQFHQKNTLYEHYSSYESEINGRRSKASDVYDFPGFCEEMVNSQNVDTRSGSRHDYISNIEVKDTRKHTGKKFDFTIHVTWSNGDVYEIFKPTREIHDLHMRLLRLFPDEVDLQKREWKSAFHYHAHTLTHREELIRTVSSYLSLLLRLPVVLKHDQVIEFFKGGNLVKQRPQEPLCPPSPRVVGVPLSPGSNTDDERDIPSYPLKSLTVCNSQLPYPQNFLVPSDPSMRVHRCSSSDFLPVPNSPRHICQHRFISQQVDSPSHSPPSSTNESPINSRSTSPSSSHSHEPYTGTIQLLKVLSLEQYADTLGKFTLEQLKSQSPEDLTKAGLPKDAQRILRSKLETINREKPVLSVNGLVDGTGPGVLPSRASPNNMMWNPVHTQYFLTPAMRHYFFAQSAVPPAVPEVVDTSPPESEVSSAPASPTQLCNQRSQARTDSSGSDDNDKERSNPHDGERQHADGRRRSLQNRVILQPHSIGVPLQHPDDMKGVVRQPSPNIFPEPKSGDGPPIVSLSTHNGFQSDANASSVTSAGYPRQPYQFLRPFNPAPAHTNLGLSGKNVINMPDGHIKHLMYIYPGMRDIPMTTSVMPTNLTNNTVGNQTYSANNDNSQRLVPPYNMSTINVMQRPIVPHPGQRSVNSATTVTVSQGGNPLSVPGVPPSGAANISVKPSNGVPLPVPNTAGTPPESVVSGRDSPVPSQSSASTTTVTSSTATSTFSGTPPAVSVTSHTVHCATCGCNCNSTSNNNSSSAGYTPQYNAVPLHYISQFHPNGIIAPQAHLAAFGHHMPPPNYPNGLNHEFYMNGRPNFPFVHPAVTPQLVQNLYGNVPQNPNVPGPSVKHKPQGCYNCGSSQHKAQECKETSMDAISGSYHLNYKPKSDSD